MEKYEKTAEHHPSEALKQNAITPLKASKTGQGIDGIPMATV